ncbi:TraY domain-containing protein [Shewanella colwelliana]|uniref:TraY domain-containing protein n=1 Tax=Shewanella colwelliana TaxID=23 RepID=UPI003735130F
MIEPIDRELVVTIRMVARNFKLLEESAKAANRDLEHEAEMRLSDHLIRFDTLNVMSQVTRR